MKDEYYSAFRYDSQRQEGGIRTAVELWCTDPAAAKQQYGPIASWDTSEITDMWRLFYDRAEFNGDISRWDVSNVTDMRYTFGHATSFNSDLSRWDVSNATDMDHMFCRAASFDQQLGDAWARSTARRNYMFDLSAGSIVGKTNNANGTPM